MVFEEWYPEQYGWSYLRVAPESRQTLKEVFSIEEMDSTNDVPSFYYDGEWLHLKAVRLIFECEHPEFESDK